MVSAMEGVGRRGRDEGTIQQGMCWVARTVLAGLDGYVMTLKMTFMSSHNSGGGGEQTTEQVITDCIRGLTKGDQHVCMKDCQWVCLCEIHVHMYMYVCEYVYVNVCVVTTQA